MSLFLFVKWIKILFTNGGGTNHFYSSEIEVPSSPHFQIGETKNKTVKANYMTFAPLNPTKQKSNMFVR
jgi:hypothetical protein